MNDFNRILAALDAAGVTGLLHNNYAPPRGSAHGCLLWAIGGRLYHEMPHGDPRLYPMIARKLDVKVESLVDGETFNMSEPELTPAMRLAHVRAWLKERST